MSHMLVFCFLICALFVHLLYHLVVHNSQLLYIHNSFVICVCFVLFLQSLITHSKSHTYIVFTYTTKCQHLFLCIKLPYIATYSISAGAIILYISRTVLHDTVAGNNGSNVINFAKQSIIYMHWHFQ